MLSSYSLTRTVAGANQENERTNRTFGSSSRQYLHFAEGNEPQAVALKPKEVNPEIMNNLKIPILLVRLSSDFFRRAKKSEIKKNLAARKAGILKANKLIPVSKDRDKKMANFEELKQSASVASLDVNKVKVSVNEVLPALPFDPEKKTLMPNLMQAEHHLPKPTDTPLPPDNARQLTRGFNFSLKNRFRNSKQQEPTISGLIVMSNPGSVALNNFAPKLSSNMSELAVSANPTIQPQGSGHSATEPAAASKPPVDINNTPNPTKPPLATTSFTPGEDYLTSQAPHPAKPNSPPPTPPNLADLDKPKIPATSDPEQVQHTPAHADHTGPANPQIPDPNDTHPADPNNPNTSLAADPVSPNNNNNNNDGNRPTTATAGNTCVVCCSRPADVVSMPCGHGGACQTCVGKMCRSSKLCYLCKEPVRLLLWVDPERPVGGMLVVLASLDVGELLAAGGQGRGPEDEEA